MARSRAKDYDDKRLIILHRSAQLFAGSGYVGTSMNMIADACRVSKALLYHYYPDKEALLFDILSAHLEKLVAAVAKADDATTNPQAWLKTIIATLLERYRLAAPTFWRGLSRSWARSTKPNTPCAGRANCAAFCGSAFLPLSPSGRLRRAFHHSWKNIRRCGSNCWPTT
jgi:AcrR family transcriptional regulator